MISDLDSVAGERKRNTMEYRTDWVAITAKLLNRFDKVLEMKSRSQNFAHKYKTCLLAMLQIHHYRTQEREKGTIPSSSPASSVNFLHPSLPAQPSLPISLSGVLLLWPCGERLHLP